MNNNFPMEIVDDREWHAIQLVINQGVDSRLEALTQSSFKWVYRTIHHGDIPEAEYDVEKYEKEALGLRLHCLIHEDDMQTFLRRMYELGTEVAETLADEISTIYYELEDE